MRVGFVVQRYGGGAVGGAERFTVDLATGLAGAGHAVEVVTSRATSYADWADELPEGTSTLDGVVVHRLSVVAPRDNDRFLPLHHRMVDRQGPALWPLAQRTWAHLMGPELAGGLEAVGAMAARCDVVVFVGYHYAHSLTLLRHAAAVAPTVLIPTAHPEGAFHAAPVRDMFAHADRVVCLARAEAELVDGLYGCRGGIDVIGCPVDPVPEPGAGAVAEARRRHGIDGHQYLVTVGRVDPAKGSDEAVTYATMARRAVLPDLQLVVVGPGAAVSDDPAIVTTGFVDEEDKLALVAGATALLQPSYMESFSLALMEGWLLGRPALVQEANGVLAGHVAASGGGVTYRDYLSFEAAVVALAESPSLQAALGSAGRAYVRSEFDRSKVVSAFERSFAAAAEDGRRRLASPFRPQAVRPQPTGVVA